MLDYTPIKKEFFGMSLSKFRKQVRLSLIASIGLVSCVFFFGVTAHADNVTFEQAIAACEAAKADFHTITQADVQSVKTELAAAVDRLDKRLDAAGTTGEAWRKYLQWKTLREELAGEPKNREALKEVYQRLSIGEEGMNLVWFLDVQRGLRQYLKLAEDVDNPKLQSLYVQNLDRLAEALKSYSQKPTTELALNISDSIRWLSAEKQAPKLVETVSKLFIQPNLLFEIDEDVINAALGEKIDETDSLNDCILKTSIQGTTHTVGEATAKLVENKCRVAIDTLLKATAYSNAVGRNGPVCIYSTGATDISAVKRLWIDENGITSDPACSSADTKTCINDIRSIKGRQFIERIAWKKAGKQLPKAEAVASRHAEARVNERIDDRAEKSLKEANDNYQKKIRKPLVDHKLYPDDLNLSSDENAMHIRLVQAGSTLIAAANRPPEVEKSDITLCLHESMVNNFALDALSGMTIRQEQTEKAVIDAFGELPEKMKPDPNEEPWGIIFAKKQPVTVTFADDTFKVTIHGAGYYKGNALHPAMDVTAVYKIEKTADGFKAVRQGDLAIFPPGFNPDGDSQLSVKQQTVRHLLEKRLGKVLEPEIVPKGFTLKGKLEKAGKFVPTQFVARDGWLVLSWKRLQEEKK
jgi:hypothetical protein